jgi:hypothetical protein
MSDGHVNKRITDIERTVARIERKLNHLETMIGAPRQEHAAPVEEHDSLNQKEKTAATLALAEKTPSNTAKPKKTSDQTVPGRSPIWRVIVRMGKWPHWVKIAEMAGIAAAIFYAAVSYNQWKDLRRNYKADQRAWVRYDPSWPEINSSSPANLPGTLTNIGKSAILSLEAEGVYEVVDAKDSPSFNMNKPHSRVRTVLAFPSEKTDFSIALIDQTTQAARPLTNDEVERLHSGSAYIAVFGWIIYTDEFGMHWYRFCDWTWAKITPGPGSAQAGGCVAWNAIGDGTPNRSSE